jgi:hypothetical protein
MYMCPIANGFRDRAVSLYSIRRRHVEMHSDEQRALSSLEL